MLRWRPRPFSSNHHSAVGPLSPDRDKNGAGKASQTRPGLPDAAIFRDRPAGKSLVQKVSPILTHLIYPRYRQRVPLTGAGKVHLRVRMMIDKDSAAERRNRNPNRTLGGPDEWPTGKIPCAFCCA
jgi:hypothetical protein